MSNAKIVWVFFIIVVVISGSTAYKKGTKPIPYDFPALQHFPEIPENNANPVTKEGASLGRYLFYDPILSEDSSTSCADCHQQKNAFSGNGNKVGTKRDVPPLFNLAWHPSFGWDGKAATIEEQVLNTVRSRNEMNLEWHKAEKRIKQSKFYQPKFNAAFGNKEIDSLLIAKALGQFLRTLLSHQSKYDKAIKGETAFNKTELEGLELMSTQTKGNCIHCHHVDASPIGSRFQFIDIGLDSIVKPNNYPDKGRGAVTGRKTNYGEFKTPSLRNIALTSPYMHDGRFKNLKEVLDFYKGGLHNSMNLDPRLKQIHKRGFNLTNEEAHKIIAFMRTMTDSAFINNPKYSNPFN